ncbi:MAG: molybdenum cofactor guanylyltransferase [Candidatus Bathyarchaeota archaeon]|nr:molybdenum cofactor guanylyltransferase [Candidatus Bathyarchaeota archaeon]
MNRAAIILAGGISKRFGFDKGLVQLAGKPLILHVIERVQDAVDEIIVCVRSESQLASYMQALPNKFRVKVITDLKDLPSCPLAGAITGFVSASSEYTAMLPCDTPFISGKVIDLLFNIAVNVNAVIPRWPNDYIEPLQAVYRTRAALEASKKAIERGEKRMRSMISLLKSVRYISTIAIREIDPKMLTFFNINTPLDLRRAEAIIKRAEGQKHAATPFK